MRYLVHVIAADLARRATVSAALRPHPDVQLAAAADRLLTGVVVAVAPTIDDALRLVRCGHQVAGVRLVIVADTITAPAVVRAVQGGARTILPSAEAHQASLVNAIRSAATHAGPRHRATPAPDTGERLTEREVHILRLVADGYSNADIARLLSCSPHTVKNVMYDLMSRLQLRNRTHAAAFAVRSGLVR